jgi:hypothetical protein
MSKLVTLLIEQVAGIIGVIVAWVVGYIFLKDEEFVRLGLDIAGYFFGLAVISTWRFEELVSDVDAIKVDLSALTSTLHTSRFLSNYFRAMQGKNPLIKDVINTQLLGFQDIVESGSHGRITMSFTRQSTVIAYPALFKHLDEGARVSATLTLLPAGGTRLIMIQENERFIVHKRGTVERILLFSVNSDLVEWQRLANEQKAIGVKIRFIFYEDLDSFAPIDDMFISTTPPMAIIAKVSTNAYSSVDLITDLDSIDAIQSDWNILRGQSQEFTEGESITRAAGRRTQKSLGTAAD